MNHKIRRCIKLALPMVLSTVACQSVLAEQVDNSKVYNIEAQSLSGALQAFSKQSGLQFAYLTEGVENVLSKGTKDARNPKEALDNMLRNTGLKYEFINEHTIAISAQQKSPKAANEATIEKPEPAPQTSTANQESEEKLQDKNKVELIVVTGSNILRAGFETNSPVQVIDRESMLGDGAKTLSDIAIKLPINVGSEFQNESGGLVGTSQFNLRGLGLGSTLTLINGRRGGQSAVADGGGNQFFDINQLPLSMIERVEFLTDGASAVYGSQAVAGVANIITRSNFEGFEITLGTQSSPGPDVDKNEIGFAFGSSDEGNTKVNIYGGFSHSNRADRTDFDFINERVLGNGDPTKSLTLSAFGSPGSFRPAITDPVSGVISGAGAFTPDPDCSAAGGVLLGTFCRYDFADQVSVIPEETRIQLFTEFSSQLSNKVKLYGESSYSSNRIKRSQGPFLFRYGLLADGNSMLVPASHPFNFFVDNGQGGITYIEPAEWDNDIHQAVDLEYRGRPFGAEFNGGNGPGDREVNLDYLRFMSGVDVELADYWMLNGSYMYASAKRDESRPYNYIGNNINNSLLNGSWNPFGTHLANPTLVSPKDGISVAGNSKETEDSLHTLNTNISEAVQQILELKVTGELGELAGGFIGVAAGLQHRKETFNYQPDPLDASGLGDIIDAPINGEQQTDAAYIEAILPVLETVEIQAALRYEDYGDLAGDTIDPKISMRWQATDHYSMRGSWGTSFQAPSVRQTSISRQSQIIDDPASINPLSGKLECVARGVTSITSVINKGDDELKPQESSSFSLGFVANFDSLDASLDFWSFDYKNLISADEGAQAIVSNDCVDGEPNDARVSRRPDGTIANITSEFINTGSVKTNGIDVSLSYDMPDASWYDSLRLSSNATYINTFEVTTVIGSEPFEGAGVRNFGNQFRSMPKIRANLGLSWKLGVHSVTAQLRYIDSYTNDQPEPDVEIESWVGTNLQYSMSLMDEQASFQVGVKNLFDQEPPSLGENVRPGYDNVIHDVLGRTLYASFTYSM